MGGGDVVRLRGTEIDARFGQMVAGNLPAVMVGVLEHWPAISRWDPANGGLEYLKSLTGTTQIQAITSKSESVFYGDIKGHERVSLEFGSFIDLILSESKIEQAATSPSAKILRKSVDNHSPKETVYSSRSLKIDSASTNSFVDSRRQLNMELYLAQVPIYSREQEAETILLPLMQDIATPSVLEGKEISNINLWMSMKSSRSSPHYDPYHNILCVVAGEKRVTLWPPSAAPYLYPLPIHGEASNHSAVDIASPNYDMHPLFSKALQNAKVVTLRAGDALFIPEGWYHQVDNVGITIGVNFWWPSKISSSLGSQMDGYILRRVISSLLDCEKKRMLKEGIESCIQRRKSLPTKGGVPHRTKSNIGKVRTNVGGVEDLTAEEVVHLKTLLASAQDALDSKSMRPQEDSGQSHKTQDNKVQGQATQRSSVEFHDDPLFRVFATLGAPSLQRVLLVMAYRFPRSLHVLVMDMLSPAAAELLTMNFEELEGSLDTSLQAEFYKQFYSVFRSPEAVMAILLEKKEEFAAQALQNVMSQFLGVSCCLARA